MNNEGPIYPGHVFTVNRDDLISGLKSGTLSRRTRHRADNREILCLHIDPRSDPLEFAFQRDSRSVVRFWVHIACERIVQTFQHAIDRASHEGNIVDRLVHIFIVDDLP